MKHKNTRAARLGRHQLAILAFCFAHVGPHSLTSNRADPAHRALATLSARGLLVRSTVGASVFASLAEGEQARTLAAQLLAA